MRRPAQTCDVETAVRYLDTVRNSASPTVSLGSELG